MDQCIMPCLHHPCHAVNTNNDDQVVTIWRLNTWMNLLKVPVNDSIIPRIPSPWQMQNLSPVLKYGIILMNIHDLMISMLKSYVKLSRRMPNALDLVLLLKKKSWKQLSTNSLDKIMTSTWHFNRIFHHSSSSHHPPCPYRSSVPHQITLKAAHFSPNPFLLHLAYRISYCIVSILDYKKSIDLYIMLWQIRLTMIHLYGYWWWGVAKHVFKFCKEDRDMRGALNLHESSFDASSYNPANSWFTCHVV